MVAMVTRRHGVDNMPTSRARVAIEKREQGQNEILTDDNQNLETEMSRSVFSRYSKTPI